ncbi:MAG TPA: DoxX family protein [Acidimicrobiales bacterium]|nr:DoxX family protein [Acidimicrobiales bacterium]
MNASATDLALLVLRLTLGIVFLAHGYNHIFGGGKIAGTGRWFDSLGMRPGLLHAWVASLTELGCGALLVLGLLTPLAAAGVIGVMVVAWITNHRNAGFFVFRRPTEGWEYVMTLTLIGFVAAILGSGAWGVDPHIGLQRLFGWTGFWIALGAGVGGGLALLAVFWRPPRKDAAAA